VNRALCLIPFVCCEIMTAIASPVAAQRPARFVGRELTESGVTYRYQLFVPADYDSTRQWPVILFLHGGAEGGSDGKRQTLVGIGPALRRWPDRISAIVVLPQAPTDTIWTGVATRIALGALAAAMREFHGDSDRVYLTGISMGGYATWQFAMEHPGHFAALVPICAGVRPMWWVPRLRVAAVPDTVANPYAYVAERIRHTPVWIFHNARDFIVPASESRHMAESLREIGAPVRHTEYDSMRHDAWTAAYADPELWRWLFAQRRNNEH
jgi:predicted peptidase